MGPGFPRQLEIRSKIRLVGSKQEGKLMIPLKIVIHGCIAMTGMAINVVISSHLKCRIQPEAEVDEPLGMHSYYYSVHL